jgi:hypothetical protein
VPIAARIDLQRILTGRGYAVGSGAVLYWLFPQTPTVIVVKGHKRQSKLRQWQALQPRHCAGNSFEDSMPRPRNKIISALCALVMAVPAMADTLPASVRACIGEADAGRRLTCYDREIARVIAPPDTFAPAAIPAPPATLAPPTSSPSPGTAPSLAQSRHLTAKVSSVHQSGDRLVVTLDNGNVWEQSVPATSQLNLRPGDTVQVDREMASWFLSDRYGNNLQVRLRQP